MPVRSSSLQKVIALIYLSLLLAPESELGFPPGPCSGSCRWEWQWDHIQAAWSPSHPADTPEADLCSLRGSHSAIPTKYLSKVPFLLPPQTPALFPPSNLASFVNISWAACMHSCTKIFLTIGTVITLLHYILHKVILFFFLPIFPKGQCINGKEKTVACKQPQKQENGVLITSTHNVRLNSNKNWKSNLD